MAVTTVHNVNEDMAKHFDLHGNTALHWVATHDFLGKKRQEWVVFVRDLISAGADLHAVFPADMRKFESPLSLYLCSPKCHVRHWVSLLMDAGVDLVTYGQAELRLWQSAQWRNYRIISRYMRTTGRPVDLMYGPGPHNWKILQQFTHPLLTWRLQPISVPGSWPNGHHRNITVPTTICWEPGTEDQSEGTWICHDAGHNTKPSLRWIDDDHGEKDVTPDECAADETDVEVCRRFLGEGKVDLIKRKRSASQPRSGAYTGRRRHLQRPCCCNALIDDRVWAYLYDFTRRTGLL